MAEFLSQEEIDNLLDIRESGEDIVSDKRIEIKKKFFSLYSEQIKNTFKILFSLNKDEIEISHKKIFKRELSENNTKYIENNFNIYQTESVNNYNLSLYIPYNKATFLYKRMTEDNLIKPKVDDNVLDSILELSENITGSFLSVLDSHDLFPHFREKRLSQKNLIGKTASKFESNSINYKNFYLFEVKIKDEIFEMFLTIENNIFDTFSNRIEKEIQSKEIQEREEYLKESFNSKEKYYSIYDYKKPNKISNEQFKAFSMIQDKMTKIIQEKLSSFIQKISDVKLYSIEQMTYGEFILSIPQLTSITTLDSKVLNSKIVTEMNPGITHKIISEILGGGLVSSSDNLNRELTNIEQKIYSKFHDEVMLSSLNENSEDIMSLCLRSENMSTNRNDIQIISDHQIVLLSVFEITIDEESGFYSICFPIDKIIPFVNKIVDIYFSNDLISDKTIVPLKENLEYKEIILKNKEVYENNKVEFNDNSFKNIEIEKLYLNKNGNYNNIEFVLGNKDIYNSDTTLKENIIILEQMVNEPMDIISNNIKIGEGETVIIHNNDLGFKIKNLLPNYKSIIDNIDNKYFIVKKEDRLFLTIDNSVLFEIINNKLVKLEKLIFIEK